MDQTLSPPDLLGQLTGYAFSFTLSLMLVFSVWCSPDSRRAGRSVFAACATLWSLGGLARCGLLAAGFTAYAASMLWLDVLTLSVVAVWPLALFMLWDTSDTLTQRQREALRWLMRIASCSGIVLMIALVVYVPNSHINVDRAAASPSSGVDEIRMAVAYNALALVLGGLLWVRRLPQSRPERVGFALILLGPLLSVSIHLLSGAGLFSDRGNTLAAVIVKQSTALPILGGLFFLGRFRAADRFARLSLRVLLAWCIGIVFASLIDGALARLALQGTVSEAVFFVSVCMAIAASLFLFEFLGRGTDRWVERQVFGKVNPTWALRQLRDELSRQETSEAALSAAEQFVAVHMQLDVRLLRSDVQPGADGRRGEGPRPGEGLRPVDGFLVRVGEVAPYILLPNNRQARRSLVSGELDVLHQVTELLGRRLDTLERERERLDRSRREASLVHKLLEAELRALRAQINPHFLFNSLNTIAALVHQDPSTAEAMTVRLARIFRHVLAQTDRLFSPLTEEMQFLQAYLEIEQIRFGERLKVEFRVSDSLRQRPVPSLILQPLVENAINHGLAPKLGECRLLITGRVEGTQMVLRVEDNGVGVRAGGLQLSMGVGLRNIRERLTALYGEQAGLSFESEPCGGSCASVYLPLTGT